MRIATLVMTLALPAAALAQDFSAGSEAEAWGLSGEEKARFEARVVDPLCEIAGDCPAECGGGKRILGLLRKADGVLVLAVKNAQPLFTGAATDLQFFCGRDVEVDGLLIGEPEATKAKLFQVQRIREAGGEWGKANRWTEVWAERNPELAKQEGPWFRKDRRVGAKLAEGGWTGLGPEAEAEFVKEWFK